MSCIPQTLTFVWQPSDTHAGTDVTGPHKTHVQTHTHAYFLSMSPTHSPLGVKTLLGLIRIQANSVDKQSLWQLRAVGLSEESMPGQTWDPDSITVALHSPTTTSIRCVPADSERDQYSNSWYWPQEFQLFSATKQFALIISKYLPVIVSP